MTTNERSRQARTLYAQSIARALPQVVERVLQWATRQLDDPSLGTSVFHERRNVRQVLADRLPQWQRLAGERLLRSAVRPAAPAPVPPPPPKPTTVLMGATDLGDLSLSLVDDQTIERQISGSRLAAVIAEAAPWELMALRTRIASLEGSSGLDDNDPQAPAALGQLLVQAWEDARLLPEHWASCASVLHEQLVQAFQGAIRQTNEQLEAAGVVAEIRAPARREEGPAAGARATTTQSSPSRAPTTPVELAKRLTERVAQKVPEYGTTTRQAPLSPELVRQIQAAQAQIRERAEQDADTAEAQATRTQLLEGLGTRKQSLKRAASSQEERATIELVDLLFQAILAEDRIPAAVRVLFARLQMPVLRVAVTEPDFLATTDHPARRLIDRMGACAMGFDRMAGALGNKLGDEIRRVVQVVEAYPDTGRRVFQTVLEEFERFIENFMRNQSQAASAAVSLAEQVEQRETLAIQYTIELRRMLEAVPVQETVRDFLFQVWADVLAITSLRHGPQSEATQATKRAAADLIWAAGAKVSREERTEVIRKLPHLLRAVREGMASAGIDAARQEAKVRELNNALAAAFTAKSAAISKERLAELGHRLETLDELLPEVTDLELDEEMLLDLSGQESGELEVAGGSGIAPAAESVALARELAIGSWHTLEFRGRSEPVQLAWQGMRRQLSLFVSGTGRCVLFPLRELAAFLESGALRPAEDEPLTARATRNVLARLDENPTLLGD